jgi:hypothetical protein
MLKLAPLLKLLPLRSVKTESKLTLVKAWIGVL